MREEDFNCLSECFIYVYVYIKEEEIIGLGYTTFDFMYFMFNMVGIIKN